MVYRTIFIITIGVCSASLMQCASTACDKAQQFRWKARQAATASEQAYYESQARLYDPGCAQENEAKYQQEKERQMRGGGK